MRTERAAPKASLLIESMRDVGYSLDTALADIIDNSITARAKNIRLLTDTTSSDPSFAIIDDGIGMNEKTLLEAMRLGSRSPLEERDRTDLGRFGLGLKTASFSQCRRLTIVTRSNGNTSCARWDLDVVAANDDWLVEIPDTTDDLPWVNELGATGTLVIWQKLDRMTEDTDDGKQDLVRRIDEATEHISLVFHRFLAGEKGLRRIAISVNNRSLEPYDPFHSEHPATDAGVPEKIRYGGHEVTVQAFILPHHQKVSSSEWEKYGGRAGYVKNQGFYVYREKRLIIYGTWFGLARQMELTKLARVKIDMPNGLDSEWQIDVKKASAHPPRPVRNRLRALIDSICGASSRVYTTRGRKLVSDNCLPVWHRRQDKNQISYGINLDHPVFTGFMSRLADDTREDFGKIIEMSGSSLPVDALLQDISGHPEMVRGETMSPEALEHAVTATISELSKTGLSRERILNMLQSAEPFRSQWEQVHQIALNASFTGASNV
jgi:Histidine kinase-, DNA gyrase B-, and HSP90-like ATPase